MSSQYEVILPNQDIPFKMFLFEGKDGNYIRNKHWHRSIEIFAVFEGALRFFVNNSEYVLEEKQCMLLNSNDVHSIIAPKPNKTIVVQIPLKAFFSYYTDENLIRFCKNTCILDKRLMELIERMYENYCEKNLGYELKVQSFYYELLYHLLANYRQEEISAEEIKQHKKLNKLHAITDYIKENYKEELALESVAKQFGYSPTYLSHIFQTYAHIKYKEYIQGIRMEHAYRQLINKEITLSEISLSNGFANQKAFAKEFQKKYNMLPSEYRKFLP